MGVGGSMGMSAGGQGMSGTAVLTESASSAGVGWPSHWSNKGDVGLAMVLGSLMYLIKFSGSSSVTKAEGDPAGAQGLVHSTMMSLASTSLMA